QLSLILGTTLDLAHETARFMTWLTEAIEPVLAALFIADEDRQELRLVEVHGFEPPDEPHLSLGLDLWRWLEEQGVPMPDENRHDRYAVPIHIENQLFGILCLVSSHRREQLAAEQRLVSTAAAYLAPVLRNVWRYQTLEQQVAQRTAELRREIIERQRAEEAYRAVVDYSLQGLAIIQDKRFVFVNQAYADIFGYTVEEMLAFSADEARALIYPEDRAATVQRHRRRLAGEPAEPRYEMRIIRKDGTVRWIETFVRPVQFRGEPAVQSAIIDITERKHLEEQLRQAQKMEALGRLAGGVAHDFNNLLTAIIGYTDLLLREFPPYDPKREDLQEIRQAAERAAALTRQLLAFSRKQVLELRVLDLNTTVSNLEKMLRRLIGEDIELVTHLAPDLDRVKADPGQIEQVIMNLAVNARDAMPQGGQLTIETKNVFLDEEYVRQHVEMQPGPYVMLAVSDTGIGMDKETMSHLFEPFFTTKEMGEGTGLGLATVYGIVKQSGGHITVYSEPGLGTTFKVYLPRTEEGAATAELQLQVPAELLQGQETILVVEDEEVVRELAVRILRKRGYTVLQAQDGAEALRVCREHQGPIHLLITDVVMPGGMSGRQVAEQLQPLQPEMKVIYMSGYTENAIVHHGVLELGAVLLQKPFTPSSLAHKVRQMLDENKPDGGTRNGS
ncbi:MAG: PAS domain S-box protein, partial [Anaerolineae bacterium]|nr:PAS domain S-box protein [Anaerolineae bacterium]